MKSSECRDTNEKLKMKKLEISHFVEDGNQNRKHLSFFMTIAIVKVHGVEREWECFQQEANRRTRQESEVNVTCRMSTMRLFLGGACQMLQSMLQR